MKLVPEFLKITLGLMFLCGLSTYSSGQSILGVWQLVKQTRCIEDQMTAESDSVQALIEDMHSIGSPMPQTVRFKEKGNGEESTKILNKKKAVYSNNFYYKFNGEALLILDKKSQTISENYTVDKFSSDSLIVSNASRPCETKVFIKIKEPRGN